MQVRIVAFARLRELLQASERSLELPSGSCAGDAWEALLREHPALAEYRASTKVAVGGRLVSFEERLTDGDELALLPPVGGG